MIFFVIVILGWRIKACNFSLRWWEQIIFDVFHNNKSQSESICAPHRFSFTHIPGISLLQILWSDRSNKFFEKEEWRLEYSTFVLKSAFCSDEVILWLRLTGTAWSIALHLLTVMQLGAVKVP